jgi:hypothetical protein
MTAGSEHTVLGEGRLQELRGGGNNSGQPVATATASVHTEEEIAEMRRRAAEKVANGEDDAAETFGHGGEIYGSYVGPTSSRQPDSI